MNKTNHQQGFTLLEVMVVVLLLTIVTAISLPSFQKQIEQGRAAAAADDLLNAFRVARSEAIKRGRFVSICASDNGTSCSGDWTKGYLVTVDAAANDSAAVQVSGVIMRSSDHKAPSSLTFKTNIPDTPIDYVRFTNLGTLARPLQKGVSGAYVPVNCEGGTAREFKINAAGVTTMSKQSCSGGSSSSSASSE